MKQEYNIAWKLQNKIVGRQLAVRREENEDTLRQTMSESTEAAHFNTTYIANYFSYCEYAKKNVGWIPFYKELDFLENYFHLCGCHSKCILYAIYCNTICILNEQPTLK